MEDILARRAYLALLFDLYGGLLTEKQQNMFDLYHQCDLSLGEIAEENGISRQAVFDVLKRTENALADYEARLGLADKENKRRQLVGELGQLLDQWPLTAETDNLAALRALWQRLQNE